MTTETMHMTDDLRRRFAIRFAVAAVLPVLIVFAASFNAAFIYEAQGPWMTVAAGAVAALALWRGYVLLRTYPRSCQKFCTELIKIAANRMPPGSDGPDAVAQKSDWRPDESLEHLLDEYRSKLAQSEREKAELRRALVDSRLRSVYGHR